MSSRPSRGAARLAAILDALPDALLLVNANGTVVNANSIALETFEAPGTALVGRGLLDLLPSFDSRRIPGSMRRPDPDDDGRTKPTRMVARRTDGTEFPVEVTSANLEDGRTPYADAYAPYTGDELLMLVVRDLTGTMDTEAELARQQRQTEMILRAASEGVVGVDTEGKVVLVNPAAAQILGFRASDLGGQELHPLIHHSRADGSPLPYEETPLADTLRSGRKHRVRGQVLWTKDRRAIPVDLTTAPVREGDQLVGAVMTFTDRSRYDTLAARHAQLREVLDASLRAPLAELRGELSGLAADPAGQLWPEANQILHHLAAGYARMTTLIDNVLAFQRLDSGKEKLDRAPAELDKVVAAGVEGAVELIGPGRAQYAVHAPPIEADVDAERLAQALAHLIADVAGVDATGRAAVVAGGGDSTIVVAAAQRGEVVRIEVRGPHSGGSPVHLPITRGIVERHGGVLQTHEVPGQGSAYVLEVPVGEGDGNPQPEAVRNRESETTVMPVPAQPARGTQGTAANATPPGAAGTDTGAHAAARSGAHAHTHAAPEPEPSAGPGQPTANRRAPRQRRPAELGDGGGTQPVARAANGPAPGSPIALPAGPSAAGPGAGGPAGEGSAASVPDQPTGRRRALRRVEGEPSAEVAQSADRQPTGRRARRALADGAQPVPIGPTVPAPSAPSGAGAPSETRQPQLPARPAAHALPPGQPAGGPGVPGQQPSDDTSWQGRAPLPQQAVPVDTVTLRGQGRRARPVGPASSGGQAETGAAREGSNGVPALPGPMPEAVDPAPPAMPGLPGLPGPSPQAEQPVVGPELPPAVPQPSGRRARKAAAEMPGGMPGAPDAAGDSAGGPGGVAGAGPVAGPALPGPLPPAVEQPSDDPAQGEASRGRHTVPAARRAPGHDTPGHGVPAPGAAAANGQAGAGVAAQNGWHGTPSGVPVPAEQGRSGAQAATGGQAISVRTLGQGVAFTQPDGQTPARGSATPPAGQQSAGGSGRRRKLAAPPAAQQAPGQGPAGHPHPADTGSNPAFQTSDSQGEGQAFAIGAPADGAEGPELLDGPGGAVEVRAVAAPEPDADDGAVLDTPRRLLVWPEPDVSTRQALTDRGYRPVTVRSREEVDAQVAEYPAALFVDPLTGPITRTALQSLRTAAVAAEVPVLVTAGLGQATREAAYGADPAVLLKALAPRDSDRHPPRVLLVESHQDIATAFTATLERRGMQVAHAASEGDAATLAAQMRPNLVVMDLMLIRRRRVGIIDWLRANGLLNRTPLVVYTSVDIDAAELPRLSTGETVLFLAERSTSAEVQGRIVDLLSKIGSDLQP